MLSNKRDQIIKTLYDYFKNKHEILFVYLFGSYAGGSETALSDIDIAIYYEKDCMSKDIEKYLDMKVELTELLQNQVDLVILNTAKPFLKSRIINKHIKILSRDTLIEGEFINRSLGEYFDIKPYIDMEYEKVISKMKEGMKFG